MTTRVKILPAILVFSIALFLTGQYAFSAEKKPAKVPVFEVPTSGKIIDVQYRPEFDEWWVKCREGSDIVIYSYEKLTRKWGKVLFTTKKPDEKGKQTEECKSLRQEVPRAKQESERPENRKNRIPAKSRAQRSNRTRIRKKAAKRSGGTH